jgi:hypothetical protein
MVSSHLKELPTHLQLLRLCLPVWRRGRLQVRVVQLLGFACQPVQVSKESACNEFDRSVKANYLLGDEISPSQLPPGRKR